VWKNWATFWAIFGVDWAKISSNHLVTLRRTAHLSARSLSGFVMPALKLLNQDFGI